MGSDPATYVMVPRHLDPNLCLESRRLRLRLPPPEDAGIVLDFQLRNRAPHARFNAPYAPNFFQLPFWQERLAKQRRELVEDKSLCLTAYLHERELPQRFEARVVATCNFTKFIRGRFQACYLGYHVDHEYEGKGYMSEALRVAIPFVFRELRMHRIMANYVPDNEASGRLLERLGFVREGLAINYLYVGGKWSDHVLTSLTNPEPLAPEVEESVGVT